MDAIIAWIMFLVLTGLTVRFLAKKKWVVGIVIGVFAAGSFSVALGGGHSSQSGTTISSPSVTTTTTAKTKPITPQKPKPHVAPAAPPEDPAKELARVKAVVEGAKLAAKIYNSHIGTVNAILAMNDFTDASRDQSYADQMDQIDQGLADQTHYLDWESDAVSHEYTVDNLYGLEQTAVNFVSGITDVTGDLHDYALQLNGATPEQAIQAKKDDDQQWQYFIASVDLYSAAHGIDARATFGIPFQSDPAFAAQLRESALVRGLAQTWWHRNQP